MENGKSFTEEFFLAVFGEEVLTGIDLQMFLNSFKENAGFETDDSDLTEARVFGLPVTRGKKEYVAGFGIYLPKTIDKIHYLQFWNIKDRKEILFDSHIANTNDIVEIGKFLSTKKATKVQRLLNYFLAAFVAYLSGRKFILVGTLYLGSTYERQLRRICPHELVKTEIVLNSEKRKYVVLYNTREEVIKLLFKAAWQDISVLVKEQLKSAFKKFFHGYTISKIQ